LWSQGKKIFRVPSGKLLLQVVRLAALGCMLLGSGCNLHQSFSPPDSGFPATQQALSGTIVALYFTMTAVVKPPSPTLTPEPPTITPTYTLIPTATDTPNFPTLTPTYTTIPPTATKPPRICTGVGCRSPNFSLPNVSGAMVSLNDFQGQVVMLNFWATWCTPCQIETPGLVKVYTNYKDRGFVILGISTDAQKTASKVSGFVRKFQINYPVLMDTQWTVGKMFDATAFTDGIPKSIFIDRNGIIRKVTVGRLDESDLEDWVLNLLRQNP
jgi:peroxiredoxin